jgi:hypothetical protein
MFSVGTFELGGISQRAGFSRSRNAAKSCLKATSFQPIGQLGSRHASRGNKPHATCQSSTPTTLKAFANSSPGLCLGNPGEQASISLTPTLKELRRRSPTVKHSQLLQSCEVSLAAFNNPGFQSKPWAGISERFQRCPSAQQFSHRHSKLVVKLIALCCFVRSRGSRT